MIPRNEALASADWMIHNTSVSFFLKMFTIHNGWATKPTARSERARLNSNIFKGFGKEEVFFITCIVMLLKTIAVNAEKTFKATFTISPEVDGTSIFIILHWVIDNFLDFKWSFVWKIPRLTAGLPADLKLNKLILAHNQLVETLS